MLRKLLSRMDNAAQPMYATLVSHHRVLQEVFSSFGHQTVHLVLLQGGPPTIIAHSVTTSITVQYYYAAFFKFVIWPLMEKHHSRAICVTLLFLFIITFIFYYVQYLNVNTICSIPFFIISFLLTATAVKYEFLSIHFISFHWLYLYCNREQAGTRTSFGILFTQYRVLQS